jgi:hypothetical protein
MDSPTLYLERYCATINFASGDRFTSVRVIPRRPDAILRNLAVHFGAA